MRSLDLFWTRVWCIPGLAQKIKVPFSRIFCLFLQFWGFKGDVKTRAKPRYAPNSGWNAFREVEVRYPPPPPQKGYLSDTGAIPYENKANWCDTPLCDTISKGYCAIGGGISHWAAKAVNARSVQKSCSYILWKSLVTIFRRFIRQEKGT